MVRQYHNTFHRLRTMCDRETSLKLGKLNDPRQAIKVDHLLSDMLVNTGQKT